MRKLLSLLLVGLIAGSASLGLAGCHADENDPEGQAGELEDPLRRHNAIANLTRIYTTALSCCEKTERPDGTEECKSCTRDDPQVKSISDAIVQPLVDAYINHPEDSQAGLNILSLLKEMRDPRSVPALTAALDWRTEVSEEHAIRAAQTLQNLKVPDDKMGEVVQALGSALSKVQGARGIDNRMRIEFLRALGDLGDSRAGEVLIDVATTMSEDQDFLINRLAAQQLGRLATQESVEAMIKALFLFDPNNPARRMNDVAAEALVRIGRPSYAPLLKVLSGKHEAANKIAKAYIAAVRQRDEAAASAMSVELLTGSEATFALGALGFRDALGPLQKELQSDDIGRRMNAAIALVRLNYEPSDLPTIREALQSVYKDADVAAKPQLIAAVRHLYDPSFLDFLLSQAKESDLHPVVRMEAVKAYAMLANKSESEALRSFIDSKAAEDSGYKEKFAEYLPALDAARQCDEALTCWIGKLESEAPTPTKVDDKEKEKKAEGIDPHALVLRKSAYMLGRLGRGNGAAIDALVKRLDHVDIEVRLAALAALDRIAVKGSSAAVEKIQALRQQEEGRAVWTQFGREALPTQARLRTRASS